MKISPVLIGAFIVLAACTRPEQKDLRQGRAYESEKEFQKAVTAYDHAIKRAPESAEGILAAKAGAKIAFYDLKNFQKAADFYHYLVLASKNPDERESAQKQLSIIYFDHLADYPSAVRELNPYQKASH